MPWWLTWAAHLSRLPLALPGPVLARMANFAQATPDITQYPFVRQLWQVSAGLAPGVVLLASVWSVGSSWLDGAAGPSNALGAGALRAAFAAGAGLTSLTVLSWLIRLNNLLAASFISRAAPLGPPSAASVPSLLGTLFGLLPYLVVLFGMAVVYVVRIAELVILAVLAPLALALAAHPTGWSVARSWWAEALAVTSLQTVQAVLLSTFTLMIRETPSLTALPMTLATSVALAYLVLRLPGWLRVWSHSSFHSDPGQLWRSLRHLL